MSPWPLFLHHPLSPSFSVLFPFSPLSFLTPSFFLSLSLLFLSSSLLLFFCHFSLLIFLFVFFPLLLDCHPLLFSSLLLHTDQSKVLVIHQQGPTRHTKWLISLGIATTNPPSLKLAHSNKQMYTAYVHKETHTFGCTHTHLRINTHAPIASVPKCTARGHSSCEKCCYVLLYRFFWPHWRLTSLSGNNCVCWAWAWWVYLPVCKETFNCHHEAEYSNLAYWDISISHLPCSATRCATFIWCIKG